MDMMYCTHFCKWRDVCGHVYVKDTNLLQKVDLLLLGAKDSQGLFMLYLQLLCAVCSFSHMLREIDR